MRHATRSWRTRVFAALGLTCSLWGAAGCVDDEPAANISWEEFRASSTRHVELDGVARDIYVVEGDLPVSLAELRSFYDEHVAEDELGRVEQESIVNGTGSDLGAWTNNQEQNLTYCVSDEFGSNKARAQQEMAAAQTAWEHAADVRFVYMPAHDANCNNRNSNVVFSVRPWTEGFACAFFPTEGPGLACVPRTLMMDFAALDVVNPATPNVRTLGIFRHELGHVLGLRHEHIRGPVDSQGCVEDLESTSLSDYDRRSVMHYPWCGGDANTDLSLTSLDRAGVRKLYGAPSVITDHRFDRVDFNDDGRDDIALSGPRSWRTLPVAFAAGNGTTFDVRNYINSAGIAFAAMAATPGAEILPGDYNGDGATDLALTGPLTWASMPVAFSNRDGTFGVTNLGITNFATWSAVDNARAVTGDFNGDGRTDIALTGASGWGSLPVAFSNGNGTFDVKNLPISNFATWAATASVKVIVGDYNNDGKHDIALTGPAAWASVPVAFSRGDGSFNVTNSANAWFAQLAATPGVDVLAGNFAGDGATDLALTGVKGWRSIPIARSNLNGTFTNTNNDVGGFGELAATLDAQPLVGDFNGDHRTDVALTGPVGWVMMPVAFSTGSGAFTVTNYVIPNFALWASTGATPVVGDFDNDGRSDVALTGPQTWTGMPVARSFGNGQFSVSNPVVGVFADLASQGGVWVLD